ncbi:Gfo/Idh/MocA family oxidoreductase [Streptomyces sp. AV19]|uniref:Gfo/Idh/MocA family protein n=1 Tax=Streptomyces sp. AV19 TaxID=2793068 RepID=UPI0018FE16FE|nr:Gfo/Idh/MocA family oxidoreductase [Streptomyces sp. AV19]MBH1937773.1 Gfo/Idh/MocA family oxidoreductase [Streptomyces sp. AV19]MDG4533661.1 Gfo/Idh/MocA family oxidoreductase [Streptomyces sp. AV19]
MELLLIGMSRFAQRRVLPAAASLPEIETINVVSSHAGAGSLGRVAKLGTVYTDWSEALAVARPGLVYVSLVNSDHTRVVRRALGHEHHVVVDKPGLPDADTAEEMVTLARSSSLVIAEATCYAFHPVFAAVESVLADLDAEVTKALAVFTPPVPAGDWRYDRAKGGGALLDTGPYAVSLGRVLWGVEPERIDVIVGDRTADALETSYGMLAGYPGGRTVVGQFGFTTAYQNMVRLMGKGFTIEIERPFSALPGMAVGLRVQAEDRVYVHSVEPADSMRVFLSEVLAAAERGSRDFDVPLLSDARALARLTRAVPASR